MGDLQEGSGQCLCNSLQNAGMFTLDGDGRLYYGYGHGDKSFRDTVDSLPSGYRMCAYAGFTLVNSILYTSGSFLLLRTNRLCITLPGADNQVCKEDPQGERHWNPNNLSWGVVFVVVVSKDPIECSTF